MIGTTSCFMRPRSGTSNLSSPAIRDWISNILVCFGLLFGSFPISVSSCGMTALARVYTSTYSCHQNLRYSSVRVAETCSTY